MTIGKHAILVFTLSAVSFSTLHAQALEEIIVTAQRREQSLQEVPISIDAISGDEIRQQGFRDMDTLADFSPSILIDLRVQDQDIAIRGVGTTGNNLVLEQAVPTFVDGIHYGRTSQIKNAFLDLEQVEVLRGPQPVYFGQNATAGAFSLTTRKPGPEWEGNLTTQLGNFGRRSIEGAAGGPITDTLGIRVAGKWDKTTGHLTDIISGDRFPEGRNWVGRTILQWTPNDQFQATWKYQVTDYDGGSDSAAIRATGGQYLLDDEGSIFVNGWQQYNFPPLPDSFSDGIGVRTGDSFFWAPPDIRQSNSNAGNVDIREMFCVLSEDTFLKGTGKCGGYESINPWDTYLNMTYRLDNGIEFSSLTGFSHLTRSYNRDNSFSPFIMNIQHREEDYDSWSQEFRISSPSGGTIEWMVGLYWQQYDLDMLTNAIRANTRHPIRYTLGWEDGEWKSAFATLTFNFFNDKASLDLGARYTDVEKTAHMIGYSGTWIFDVEPVSLAPNQYIAVPGGWTMLFNSTPSRSVPVEWSGRAPVGYTPLVHGRREGNSPYLDTFAKDDINPQITLRYRPTSDISLYARWAQAFKAGGSDAGRAVVPDTFDAFSFDEENAENWELGVKGTFWDGRARANLSLFWMEVEGLQLASSVVDLTGGDASVVSKSTNAGLQRVRGAEFDVVAQVTDRLKLGLNGALMDGTMVDYQNAGCTDAEFEVADTGPCISVAESMAMVNSNVLAGLIDRSGSEAPRTPDWILIANMDYWIPVLDRFKTTFNGKFKISDGYITNVESFSLETKMNRHADMNLSVGFGDMDDTWSVSIYGRNLLEAMPSYNAEYDVSPDGITTTNLSPSHFRTYGVQLEYNY